MKKSNYETNTGHRFISETNTAYKIHIHCPDDSVLHMSVGYLKCGKSKGLRKAVALRNRHGFDMWGKYWKIVLRQPEVFTRLPHSLEPKVIHKPRPTKLEPDRTKPYYIAKWVVYGEGTKKTRSVLASIDRYGKLAAYSKAKKALMNANKHNLGILSYMGRVGILDLK
ncbi:Fe3+-citrate ABC transporter substrate-binding protein [Vibrio sp. 1180_3]|uniref:Fe3+-citrate ABC transporter substrate-binding protein n=1 Tax=Vibrio sp. 1180_3 TaxID=2528832 RepID=UPI0024073629|nr:Fe3+-citrate ABC transporter substrate-binding protein [Vibrio sp. 1180_3]MDF9399171.1 Fe3+-citrate ABC transporter substrate-binding protein [Vibrio sp. 1180_3]